MMRSSRRNLGLNPEITPQPTPPSSNDEDFSNDIQIETTLEEEERYRREEEGVDQRSDIRTDNSSVSTEVVNKDPIKNDIIFSSDVSDSDGSSDESVKIVEKEKLETKSSERHYHFSIPNLA